MLEKEREKKKRETNSTAMATPNLFCRKEVAE
jgi:hypothetical protein